jgi:hypothetical protein
MVEYDGSGQPIGVTFAVETAAGPRAFGLPANVEGVRKVLHQKKINDANGQAERTAWRNVRDWALAQAAIIEAGMVQIEEVFLPYMTDGTGQTLYPLYKGGQLGIGDGQKGG